uniref:VASt domain-containing protein n=1 Tax=Esox lucius TaxID=8010 RepID=A0A6Q2ZET0_ESOLU
MRTMSASNTGPKGSTAQHIPTLNILPPSSDTEAWSRSPSPRPPRRHHRPQRTKARTKKRSDEEHKDSPKPRWDGTEEEGAERVTGSSAPQRGHSPRLAPHEEDEVLGPTLDLLLPPSSRVSRSRSSSPGRRSRWSLRGLLGKESDWDSCSTASNSPRSTPGSSPSLRRRVLGGGGGGRTSDAEGGSVERPGERGGSDSPLPSSSAASAYPIASRHFSRNAKKMQSWYNVLSPTYKQRNEDFRKLFKKLPDTERLIVDYSCALQKDILLQGRLYLSENWLCFYSNIFRWETTITILLKDVTTLTKEKTAKLIPNAIQISTDHDKHFFTSFGARDRSYMMIFRLWQNALMDKPLSPKELWHIVHQCYGTELGLTSEDDDYVSPTSEHINGLLLGNLSLDQLTNDDELPTDPSNSSDTQEEGEVESFCADLAGRLHINMAVRMSVDKLHDLLFSADTHFIQHLFSQRHFTDLSVGEWQKDNSPSGNTTRVLSYTIAINNPLGPKTAPVVETQTLYKNSAPGECYVVDSEVITSGIPYQDYFYTVHRYCLTSISKHKSRLRVSSNICYRKQPWSLVKALIEKNTWSGIEEYYRHMESEVCKLETLLQSEVSVVTSGDAVGGDAAKTPPALRRRKRTCSRRQMDREREGGGLVFIPECRLFIHNQVCLIFYFTCLSYMGPLSLMFCLLHPLPVLSLALHCSLVVLVALNMLLFYKLYSLERAAHTLETWHSYSLSDSPLPQTAGEWAQVLQLQRQFHQAQLGKWQHILQSSVTLLDQVCACVCATDMVGTENPLKDNKPTDI